MKIGRNDPCPCGSGKKYKKCCMNGSNVVDITKDIADLSFIGENNELYEVGYTSKGETGWFIPARSYNNRFDIISNFIHQYYHADYHLALIHKTNRCCAYIREPISAFIDNIGTVVQLVQQYNYDASCTAIMLDSEQKMYLIACNLFLDDDITYSYINNTLTQVSAGQIEISYTSLYHENRLEEMKTIHVCENEDVLAVRNHKFASNAVLPVDGDINKCMTALMNYCKERENLYNVKGVYASTMHDQLMPSVKRYNDGLMNQTEAMWLRSEITREYQAMVADDEGMVISKESSADRNYYGVDACMKDLPILALPNVNKLSLFFEDISMNFPLETDLVASVPFNNFIIKVSDMNGVTVNVVVHKKESDYELIGLSNTDRNGKICGDFGFIPLTPNIGIMQLISQEHFDFGYCDNEKYCAPVLRIPHKYLDTNWYEYWSAISSLYNDESYDKETFNDYIMPSSVVLLIHIWMYALAMYNVLLSVRKIKYINTHTKTEHIIRAGDIQNLSNKSIIDLGKEKRIYEYNTDEERDTIFRQYHILSTTRRGHFRHYKKSGLTIYIPPTTVTFSEDKLAPDAHERTDSVIYRNSEDFLRTKSYLEDDVNNMLKQHGVERNREKMFSWMGRKKLDFYLPDKNIAIECQGVQHFYRYGGNDTELELRQQRDEDKYNECAANGIKVLYYVSPLIPIPEEMKQKHYYITDLDELYQMIQKG